jgi:signal transduction histidine kinase
VRSHGINAFAALRECGKDVSDETSCRRGRHGQCGALGAYHRRCGSIPFYQRAGAGFHHRHCPARRELAAARVKAEESDRLKSAFLANMSHEIRTPLNAIVGFSRLVIDPGHEGDKEDYCNIIEKNSELLLCLFNDILDLSEMEAGALEFTREKVSLYHVCLEEYDSHRLKVSRGVTLILDNVDEKLCVMGDRMRITQVLMNLLSNAVKFTPTGEIHFGYQLRGNIVQFYVKDTGIGIPANRVAKIFERFGKINNFAQGTGLGLTVSRMLVERMGGRIWVRSGEGIGTTFFFTLPLG